MMSSLLVTRCSRRLAHQLTGTAKQTQLLVTRRAARQLTGAAKQTQSLVKHLTVREVAAGRAVAAGAGTGRGRAVVAARRPPRVVAELSLIHI